MSQRHPIIPVDGFISGTRAADFTGFLELYCGSQPPLTLMFSVTLTDPTTFGNTYQWAILSVLPMDSDKTRHGLNSPEIKKALGLSNAARTSLCLMLNEMAQNGLVRRYDIKIGSRRIVSYKRLIPLRKRDRIARWIRA